MPAITDPLLLPGDVRLVPVAELAAEVRQRIECDEGDVAITRLRSRTPSKVLDADSADLVERFREAATIADAVIAYCSDRGEEDPEKILEAAFPVLQDLINDQLLVPAGSTQAADIQFRLAPGETVGGFTIVRRVQLLEDTELYQARAGGGGRAAVKIARYAASAVSRAQLARERAVLERLDGASCPRLLDHGELDGHRYLVLEWCEGINAAGAAAEHRTEAGAMPLELVERIAGIYASLHERGVLHGDVHPSNLLVDRAGEVRVIDFGLARLLDGDAEGKEPPRGGVPFFFDPEYSAARLAGERPPRVTAAAEQYSLAALLYHLATGEHYQDFSLGQDTMLRQILEGEPRSFAALGLAPAPALEEVLRRALAKDPAQRFASVREMADRLSAAVRGVAPAASARPREVAARTAAGGILRDVLEAVRLEGPLLERGLPASPTASVNNGAAGVAWVLYRLAQQRGDGELLALADVWAASAVSALADEGALYNPEIEMTREIIGEISTFHSPTGIYAVRALIALAMGARVFLPKHLAAYVQQADRPCDNLDLTLGWSSVLLTTSALVAALGDRSLAAEMGLLHVGDSYLARLWERLDGLGPIRQAIDEVPSPGIAHGWGGFAYATLRWCEAAGRPLPESLPRRLEEIAELGELIDRGIRWPWRLDAADPVYMPGWCNGTAGYVFLWALAHAQLGGDSYRRLAELSAWNAWEDPATVANLCCGFTGRAYALLHWHKRTGERIWLDRARLLAERAAVSIRDPRQASEYEGFEHSLYKGELGLAALVADLETPGESAFPFFESEGWPAASEPADPEPAQ